MTIKVTDEMIYAFAGEPEITATDAHAIRIGLAAVLAIAERDRLALVEWHWAQLEPCPSPDPEGTWNCEREAGHEGAHRALRWFREWTDEPVICRPCQRAADYAAVIGAGWATSKHRQCRGDTWCDCQHRIPDGIPYRLAPTGTPENGRLVAIAAGIELEDRTAEHQARLAEETS